VRPESSEFGGYVSVPRALLHLFNDLRLTFADYVPVLDLKRYPRHVRVSSIDGTLEEEPWAARVI